MPLHSNSSTRVLHRFLAVALVTASAATPSAAATSKKVLDAMVAGAQREFDAGNFARAGDLFLAIWRQDRAPLAAIYNAARAYQLAGNLERAKELFEEMMALPNLEAAVREKCEAQLGAIRLRRSEAKAEAAAKAERDGDMALAAGLWGDALALQPEKRVWQLRRARAQHLAGRAELAREGYEAWLRAAAPDDPERRNAERWLAELKPKAAAPAAAVAAVVEAPGSRLGVWATLGGGALALIGGGVVLALANADEADLQAKMAQTDASGEIVGISHADATATASSIETRYRIGWAAAGAGVAAIGAGVWLLVRAPESSATLLPAGRGVVFALRF